MAKQQPLLLPEECSHATLENDVRNIAHRLLDGFRVLVIGVDPRDCWSVVERMLNEKWLPDEWPNHQRLRVDPTHPQALDEQGAVMWLESGTRRNRQRGRSHANTKKRPHF
jgi:hypothetical protein